QSREAQPSHSRRIALSGTLTAGVGIPDWEYAERPRYGWTAGARLRWNTAGTSPDYASFYNEFFVNFGPDGQGNALGRNRTTRCLGLGS
ncbi:MAG: hypothetical protein ACRYGF_07220, partial [Janthinobacterium lividum]